MRLLVCLVDPRSGLAAPSHGPQRVGSEPAAAQVVDAVHLVPRASAPTLSPGALPVVPWVRLAAPDAASQQAALAWVEQWQDDPRRFEEAGRVWVATAAPGLAGRTVSRGSAVERRIGWIWAHGTAAPEECPPGVDAQVSLSRLDEARGVEAGRARDWPRARRRAVLGLMAPPEHPPVLAGLEFPEAGGAGSGHADVPLPEELDTWIAFARARQAWLGSAQAPLAWVDAVAGEEPSTAEDRSDWPGRVATPVATCPTEPIDSVVPARPTGPIGPLDPVHPADPEPVADHAAPVMAPPPGAFETVADLRAQWGSGRPAWLLEERSGGPDLSRPARVSVVVPAYNHRSYVEEALASVLAQGVEGLELVIVDDESTDATFEVAADFLDARATIPWRLLRRRNGNAFTAINTGLAVASGEYLAILNSDDAYRAGRLARIVGAMQAAGSAFGFSRVHFVDDAGRPVEETDSYAGGLAAKFDALREGAGILETLLTTNVTISTGNHVLRRDLVDAIGGYAPLRLNHDWHFVLSASFHTPLAFVDEPLYAYRLHGANTIAGKVIEGSIEAHWLRREFLSRLDRHPVARTPALAALLRAARDAGLGALLPEVMRSRSATA